MELVTVHAKVEDVERAHRRPAILVGEGDRDEAVRLNLLAEGLEIVHRRRDGVALFREQALAIEDGPRVVVNRDEVLVTVVAGRSRLEGSGVVGRQG